LLVPVAANSSNILEARISSGQRGVGRRFDFLMISRELTYPTHEKENQLETAFKRGWRLVVYINHQFGDNFVDALCTSEWEK